MKTLHFCFGESGRKAFLFQFFVKQNVQRLITTCAVHVFRESEREKKIEFSCLISFHF